MFKLMCARTIVGLGALGLLSTCPINTNIAHAQQLAQTAQTPQADAPLIVDGTVRQVFRSPRQSRTDYLVEIEVQRSEGRRAPSPSARLPFPGPGERVYVHVFERTDRSGRVIAGESHTAVPSERAQVRAYLAPRPEGGWQGTFPDWFEVTSSAPAEQSSADPAPPAVESLPPQPATSLLGMTAETAQVQGRVVVRVTSVERRGPAQQAGLETGDLIASINGKAIEKAEQLEEVARQGVPFSLVVVDVRSGRAAQVQVTPPAGKTPSTADTPATTPAAPPARVALGVSAESVAIGSRTALKVTRVEPGSPAAKAGLEPGDVIVEAGGAPITAPDQLLSAVRKSGPTLELTVRDSRTGRDTPVKVELGGAVPPATMPSGPAIPQAEAGSSHLGIVTEMALHDDEFAVKVTEVEAGSPAARAGLRPGVLILEVNGQAVLHPDDLMDAVRQSGKNIRLTVADPTSGRKETISIAQ